MKLLSFAVAGRDSWGAVAADGGVVDLGRRFGARFPTLRHAIAAGALTELAAAAAGAQADFGLADIEFRLPLPDPDRVFCIGRNYKGHVAEAGLKLPEHPSLFLRLADSLVPHGGALVRPRVSGDMDYEGELAFVIGKPGRHIARADALEHIFGYTILNDGSVRDYQFKHSLSVGKNFARTGSVGPWLVTSDEIPDPTRLHLSTRLNGVEVQHSGTDDLIFDIPTIIGYLSTFTPLRPGDVVATGTPDGVGFARTPPLWLKPGDVIEVEISSIGVLRNTVVAEQP
jgi:2-keto-4-pentenoate hydratase/2-oxohepta-3-ene-1,7-dioic acid hydratase in catechol pathway